MATTEQPEEPMRHYIPQRRPASAASGFAQAPSAAPSVGSMARVLEIQEECLADDLPVHEKMASWSEAQLREYFESGGETQNQKLS